MKISKREMILAVATLSCVLFGGTWYALDAKWSEYKEQKGGMTGLRDKIQEHYKTQAQQRKWNNELAELQSGLVVFPKIEDQPTISPEIIRDINLISSVNGLELTGIKEYGEEEKTGDLYELVINCSWSGSMEELVDTLFDISEQTLKYDITTFSIKPPGRNSTDYTGTMNITCSYMREK